MTNVLMDIQNLEVKFPIKTKQFLKTKTRYLSAVDDISFRINRGETVGLVGESGSGKTTVGRAILRAIEPTSGDVIYHGPDEDINVSGLEGDALRAFRQKMNLIFKEGPVSITTLARQALRTFRPRMSLVFQDPYSSLNPRMTVRDIIAEPLIASGMLTKRADIDARVRSIAARCKLNLEHLRRFPHAFSGGQRQRVCIARALVTEPEFVVCDESVSALDVSIQAEVVNLLKDLQAEMGVSFLFIAHDLSVVAQISHRVAVMYVGKLVEYAPTESLFFNPRHPYTHALLSAVPQVDVDAAFNPIKLDGEIPNPTDVPSGCRFRTRCPYAKGLCAEQQPEWRQIASDHYVACHFSDTFDFSRSREDAQ